MLLGFPVTAIFWRTFQHGLAPVVAAVMAPAALHALWLTLLIVGIAVPANTVFGVLGALTLARGWRPLRGFLDVIIDLPFAISPVVVGLALMFVYGRTGWLGGWLTAHGVQVIFALPGMILATIFVSLPFVIREVTPVLREVGTDQEQAAMTLGASGLQTFFRITLPSIRWGLAYGVVLTTARALGEFGAVSVIAGHVSGVSQTLTLYVDDRFQAFDFTGAYTASIVLAVLALLTLFLMNTLAKREGHYGY
jgi:sulfate/thiosulfate transport system permease protein